MFAIGAWRDDNRDIEEIIDGKLDKTVFSEHERCNKHDFEVIQNSLKEKADNTDITRIEGYVLEIRNNQTETNKMLFEFIQSQK